MRKLQSQEDSAESFITVAEIRVKNFILIRLEKFCALKIISALINSLGKKPLVDLLRKLGGWPMVDGKSWKASSWSWNNAIKELRKFIDKKEDDLVVSENEIPVDDSGFTSDDFAKHEKYLKELIEDIVTIVGTSLDRNHLQNEIKEVIQFEKDLDENERKYAKFLKLYKKKKLTEIIPFRKDIRWLNFLQVYLVANRTKYDGDVEGDFDVKYLEFLQNTPQRS